MNIIKLFNRYLSLYIVPLLLALFGVYIIITDPMNGWSDLVAAFIWTVDIFAILVITLFLIINQFVLKWKLNWWKNILMSIALFILTYGIFFLLTQA